MNTVVKEICIGNLCATYTKYESWVRHGYLAGLAEQLKKNGCETPIYVQLVSKDGDYFKIIDGEKRVAAAVVLGWKTIPCFVNMTPTVPTITYVTDGDSRRAFYIDGQIAADALPNSIDAVVMTALQLIARKGQLATNQLTLEEEKVPANFPTYLSELSD
jgi:hypothetical protein